ncbi:uncharacterized protein ACJ7VT_008118 [Polymixia lowei]
MACAPAVGLLTAVVGTFPVAVAGAGIIVGYGAYKLVKLGVEVIDDLTTSNSGQNDYYPENDKEEKGDSKNERSDDERSENGCSDNERSDDERSENGCSDNERSDDERSEDEESKEEESEEEESEEEESEEEESEEEEEEEKRKPLKLKQQDGDINSSEVAEFLDIGVVDTYSRIKRHKRDFSKGKDGDKGYVEADHIPPLDSFKKAMKQDGFSDLLFINPALYEMVTSLVLDRRGEHLITAQVSTHHHRDALSTGNSRVAKECRLLLSRRIARGDAKTMLKQAFMIAHPYVSRQIREDAGIGNRPPRRIIFLSRIRTMNLYRRAFISIIDEFYRRGIITHKERCELIDYVNNDMYLDRDSELYQELVEIVRRYGKRFWFGK